jgi:hypothetical protein
MFERHSLNSGRVFCNRSCQMSSAHKMWSHNVSCSDFDISTKQYWFFTNCARKTHWEGASNKKSIRWIFCLRARVNDASDYQWGVRLSTEKKFASPPWQKKYNRRPLANHIKCSDYFGKFSLLTHTDEQNFVLWQYFLWQVRLYKS